MHTMPTNPSSSELSVGGTGFYSREKPSKGSRINLSACGSQKREFENKHFLIWVRFSRKNDIKIE